MSAPFDVAAIANRFGTPTWVYEESVIRARVEQLKRFDCIRFAQKANSNIGILSLMRQLGVVVDAVSAGELYRAVHAGFTSQGKHPGIVFTADIFDDDALSLIAQHKVPVNIGSPEMINVLAAHNIKSDVILRINPGFGHGHSRKTNTGGEFSKHGIWHEQLEDVLANAKRLNVRVIGLHMHIGSGSDFAHLRSVCDAMVSTAARFEAAGFKLEVVSAGGGLPIPYRKDGSQTHFDTAQYFDVWDAARKRIEQACGHPVTLEVEPGRFLVAESGWLVARVNAVKSMGATNFILVDAGFTELVRPAFYGSYHHISIVPSAPRDLSEQIPYAVAGPLCESGDVFTQEDGGVVVPRLLPRTLAGDYLLLHDAGAYGASMSSNYNSRRLAAEVLISTTGELCLIRSRQPMEDLIKYDIVPQHLK